MGHESVQMSATQIECLRLVASGVTQSKMIARELKLAPGTVDSYLSRACKMMGVDSRAEAAQRYFETIDTQDQNSGSGSGSRLSQLGGAIKTALIRLVAATRWLFSVPPVSGPEHGLTWIGKTLAILRIATVSLSLVAVLVIVQAGLLWLSR